ncbi:MAG: T9SS type A sorting domain-containing protein [bacterium]
MKNYIRFIFLAFFFTAVLVQAQPNVPTINVDTLWNGGFTSAGTGGALFTPDGNSVIVMKNFSLDPERSTPIILDAKTGKIIRFLDTLKNYSFKVKISKDGTKLVVLTMGPELTIWDIPTGKIIKSLGNIRDYCLSPDGTKLYICGGNPNHLGAIRVVDLSTFEEIERFCSVASGYYMDISPDGQIIALSASRESSGSDNKDSQVILININDKNNYTVIETGQAYMSMNFSPDGKQIAISHTGGNPSDLFIFIYNLETKEKKYIRLKELSTLFGFDVVYIGTPFFVDLNTILFMIRDLPYDNSYFINWNIPEHRVKSYIGFNTNQSIDIKDSTVLLCSRRGLLGYLNKNVVSVQDNLIFDNTLITYSNNQLEFNSEEPFSGLAQIYDLSGKLVANPGTQIFSAGRNIIPVNQTLPLGVYILTIINGEERISGKFMVE